MINKVKSGKEILDDFFNELGALENVDPKISGMLKELYDSDKLTDINVKNKLQKLRDENGNQA
tara:strand:+ start:8325 stop:8513 length:189 start_codon:yes stop_codon:yes gene_type:complete